MHSDQAHPVSMLVTTQNGVVEGSRVETLGLHVFKGLPFAAPPVGTLRWKPPQPVTHWAGVRKAKRFGPRAMQLPIFGDMNFRSAGMSEDCLYLNLWTPARSTLDQLPVLVYFYGGGNIAGDGSEPRYDGASLAQRGIVTLTVNYRLNVFGFLAHPDLTQESPQHTSGNYGYLDQIAALYWVRHNITAFGGDPNRITIAGESAGSIAVSALMLAPLARELIVGAIGSSGSLLDSLSAIRLAEAEQKGRAFAVSIDAPTLTALRALPADRLLEATAQQSLLDFSATIDGYFLPKHPEAIFSAGEQAHVPLLVGWNSEEMSYQGVLGPNDPTPANFAQVLQTHFGIHAAEAQQYYPATTPEDLIQSATDLASDLFIGYSTWKWSDLHSQTGAAPVYRYYYAHPRPPMRPAFGNAVAGLAGGIITGPEADAQRPPEPRGAVHSADIEYALGNLTTNLVYVWTAEDYQLSELLQTYYANFVTTGDPNSPNLPLWPAINRSATRSVMWLEVNAQARPEQQRERYQFLDRIFSSRPKPE